MGLDADHDNALLGQTRVSDTFASMPMIFQLSSLLGQKKEGTGIKQLAQRRRGDVHPSLSFTTQKRNEKKKNSDVNHRLHFLFPLVSVADVFCNTPKFPSS